MLWQRELNRWTLGDSNPRPPALIAGGELRKHRSYFVEKNIVGGRGGTRTRGPLLAKQVGKNPKCFCWCHLQRKPSKFPLLNCTEVVPRYRIKRSHDSNPRISS